jgi:hypothetical protein
VLSYFRGQEHFMASKYPPNDDQPKRADLAGGEARELNQELKQTVREAMARAGAVGLLPAEESHRILRQARRRAEPR